MKAPQTCPPFGVSLPVRLVEIRDGDTIVVTLRQTEGLVWAVRLIDCWCPELHRGARASQQIARDASEYVRQVLVDGPSAGDLRWFIPLPEIEHGTRNVNLLSWLSFDRIPGYLFVGPDATLNRLLVQAGLASSTKGGPLGQ